MAGLALSPFYPVIKVCWTTTYNQLAGGISFLLMAGFYLVIDVWHFRKWTFFFRVIGMNSIFVYLFVRIVPVAAIAGYFTGWITKPLGDGAELAVVSISLLTVWLVLYYMYRKKIFIKV